MPLKTILTFISLTLSATALPTKLSHEYPQLTHAEYTQQLAGKPFIFDLNLAECAHDWQRKCYVDIAHDGKEIQLPEQLTFTRPDGIDTGRKGGDLERMNVVVSGGMIMRIWWG